MLVQANSGGGKSWVLRRILEQSNGKVQQIIIDIEGEFSTLREKYDYIHVGKGGDIPADIRSAGLLAERLLELNASAIIDLYELKHYDRIRYVKLFLDAMINIRKELWHPCLVVIDEAHLFAPEKGESEALSSVIDICTRGRKRSFCVILATQRLSKLHKDAAAECNNKLIGRTGLDIDVKRASEELGFSAKEDQRKLRQLKPGEFFVFGPAISTEVIPVTIGEVLTTHPDVGSSQKKLIVPPTPQKIKTMLSQLNDLPKEAEEKQKSLDALKAEVSQLKRQLSQQPKAEFTQAEKEKLEFQISSEYETKAKRVQMQIATYELEAKARAKTIIEQATKISEIFKDSLTKNEEYSPRIFRRSIVTKSIPTGIDRFPQTVKEVMRYEETGSLPELRINAGARRLLNALLSWYPKGMTEGQWRSHAGLKKSGTYGTYKSTLRTAGLIEERDGLVFATEQANAQYADTAEPAPQSTEEVLALWNPKLGLGARRMLAVLVDMRGERITNEELAERSGMSTSGTFGTYKSQLRTAHLIGTSGQYVWADKETLFL